MSIVADWSKYPNFQKHEFDCECGCGFNNATDELLSKLQNARFLAKVPFSISSGCRCQKHNDKQKDSVSDSAHVKGFAADIRVSDSQTRFKVLTALFSVGFSRIGVANSFIHCDCDSAKPQNLVWTY
jgi:uncharacterized protein YcbK (DUF882 family)